MGTAENILVVEDERIVARDIQRTLMDFGYDVPATAASSAQAVALASERCPDLVLMDIRIKGEIDGIDTAKILRERFDVPVVYLTAYADGPTVDRAKATEPFGYLLKPVKSGELKSTVEIALYKHRMERKHRERERWLATTLNSIGDAVVSTDTAGAVNYMNPVAEKLTGWTLVEAMGHSSKEVVPLTDPATARPIEDPFQFSLREGETIFVDGLLSRRTGPAHSISDSTAPVIDERGHVHGAVMAFRDVSEQKSVQNKMEHADRLISLGTLAAGVAHEINNPLGAVMLNVGMALDLARKKRVAAGDSDGAPSEMEQILVEAKTATDRIRVIVAEVKIFCGSQQVKAEAVDVRHAIEKAISLTSYEWVTAKVIRQFHDVPLVSADPNRLGQVVINLLINSAQAMKDCTDRPREIRITTRTGADGSAIIEVTDNGPGISPENLKRVFEPFFTTKPVGLGMGLGLSVCRGIVKSLGGEITIRSVEGAGATVRVVLPAEVTPDPHPNAPDTAG